ncbi:sigma-54 dependent transcriptional regulator [Hyphomicrobium sp. D-2]|uniref:sigma-54-dependent transcriptional regulator n=1 Tax=Hyphomicrobium sp. D-2 TaxID=3041621 RepID=UPI002455D64B|nr:sigma-54 dependent transcriptional regulator [Hyphomicrobium sp. D-2]MDH4982380.1 sigma-54 dependent transcriptional regulator [Hyphomicrobium sp. D-2]
MVKSLLIVDDDPTQRRILEETIKRLGFATKTAGSGEQALQILEGPERGDISLVLLDLVMAGVDGMAVLEKLGSNPGTPPIIVQTAHGSIDAAINAMRAGAVDFVVKPVSPERLEVSIKSALKIEALAGEITRIKKKVEGTLTFADLVVQAEGMERVVALGKRAAASNIPVLIEGESGVGKELIARAIQGESERAGKPFVVVNCGAIPENLIESTLFGHEKGAFTGAVDKRIGKFQEADGGTLFLDEVGELPLDAQVKLLRALQEGEIDPVGAKKSVNVNFRLISATNRNMIDMVREGKFREDLYYRLNVFPIWVPPLRERLGDVAELARHFIARFAAEEGKRISGLSEDALRLIRSYPWPGNVRQLENAVFRAVVLADGPELTVAEFPQIAAHVTGFETAVPAAPAPAPKQPAFKGPAVLGAEDIIPQTMEIRGGNGGGHASALGIPVVTEAGDIRSLDEIEADMIRLALGRYRGHMTEVAKRLKIGRSTLYRKMQEYGLEPRA